VAKSMNIVDFISSFSWSRRPSNAGRVVITNRDANFFRKGLRDNTTLRILFKLIVQPFIRLGSATPGQLTEERREGLNAVSLDGVIAALM
jgi:hypothetical protein